VSEERRDGTDGSGGWPPPPATGGWPPPPPTPGSGPPAEGTPVWATPAWAMPPAASRHRPPGWPVPRERLRSLATWARGLLVVVLAFQVLSAIVLWGTPAGRSLMTFDPAQPPTMDSGQVAFTLVSFLASVPTIALVVVFLVWQHRCHTQLVGLGRGEVVPYSPGLGVGCWFIPFANLVMPLLAVRGLFRAAHDTEGEPVPRYVLPWWLALVVVPTIGGVVGSVRGFSAAVAGGSVEPTTGTLALSVLSTASILVAGVLALRLIRDLTDRVVGRSDEAGLP
jgi:eukaryotic-like serine/threonine-protein kinase